MKNNETFSGNFWLVFMERNIFLEGKQSFLIYDRHVRMFKTKKTDLLKYKINLKTQKFYFCEKHVLVGYAADAKARARFQQIDKNKLFPQRVILLK